MLKEKKIIGDHYCEKSKQQGSEQSAGSYNFHGSENCKVLEKQGSYSQSNNQEPYQAKDIQVLKNLDAIRKRPGMYIGSTDSEGLHHLVWECLDNSLDEATNGYCKNIEIILLPENKIAILDDGRGIPVDIHPETGKSALETAVTTLHAGAKFNEKSYKRTGGLHGVGISAVCALSKWMRVEVKRNHKIYYQTYAKGKILDKIQENNKIKIKGKNENGTLVIFQPDETIFSNVIFNYNKILNKVRQQAYLTKGIKIVVRDWRRILNINHNFYFQGGIVSYIKYLTQQSSSIHKNIFYIEKEKNNIFIEVALQYTDGYECFEESFVNGVLTQQGGTHLTGFRLGLTRALNNWIITNRKNSFKFQKAGRHNSHKENFSITNNDIREGLVAVVSVKLRDPLFEGQTKSKLGNTEVKMTVNTIVFEALSDFFEKNTQDIKVIVEKIFLASKARKAAQKAREIILKKNNLKGLKLPGKLTDCQSSNPDETELYIVEGDSAGGSAKQARDSKFQAILPLKGKILNVERVKIDKILNFEEIKSLILAIGTSIGDDFDIRNIKYKKIIIMCDADSDGNHIKALILTLFYRYFQELIIKGYVYIAQPPLYKLQYNKKIRYAYTEKEKEKAMKEIKEQRKNITKIDIQRYKGLGEMNPDQLWETTMSPENRLMKQIKIKDFKEADSVFDILMGKITLPRKRFIESYADKVNDLDI